MMPVTSRRALGLFVGAALILGLSLLRAEAPWPAAPAEKAQPPTATREKWAQLRDKLLRPVTLDKPIDPGTPLKLVLEFMGERHDLTILLDEEAFREAGVEGIAQQPVQLSKLAGVSLGTILRRLVAQHGGAYLLKGDHIEVTTLARARPDLDADAADPRRHVPVVHFGFDNRPLDKALLDLADQSAANVVLDPRAGEKGKTPVTAHLNNVPLDTALRVLANLADLKMVQLDNIYLVTTAANAQALRAEDARGGAAK